MRYGLIHLLFVFTCLISPKALADCTAPAGVAGATRWSSADLKMYYCNGTVWKNISYGGLQVKSVTTDPSAVQIDTPSAIASSGNYTYVADSSGNDFSVIDASAPGNPTVVATLVNSLFAGPRNMVVDGNYAYLLAQNKVVIIDVSNPTAPVVSGSYSNSSYIGNDRSIKVVGNYVYTVGGSKGLLILDVSSKTSPTFVSYTSISSASGLDVQGGYAYVSTSGSFYIFDVSNPSAVTQASVLTATDFQNGKSLVANGNYVYVLGQTGMYQGQLSVVNITNKSAPVIEMKFNATDYGYLERAEDIEMDGNFIYVSQNNGRNSNNYVSIYNVTNPANPQMTFLTLIPNSASYGKACDHISVGGSHVSCIFSGSPAIYIMDRNPKPVLQGPVLASYFDKKPWHYSVSTKGNTMVGMDSNENLFAYDISNPSSILEKGSIALPDPMNRYSFEAGLFFDGTYAYVTTGNTAKVFIVDFSGAKPVVRSIVRNNASYHLNTPDGIVAAGGYVYVAAANGLTIIDANNPAAASIVGHINLFTNSYHSAKGVWVSGSTVYVSSDVDKKIAAVDVTTKNAPALLGTFTDATNLNGVYKIVSKGNYVLANTWAGRLVVVDFSTPSAPVLAYTSLNTTYFGRSNLISVSGNYLYTEPNTGSVVVHDISNPAAPTYVSTLPSQSQAPFDVDGTVGVSGNSSGIVSTFNLSNPASPTLYSSVSVTGDFYNMTDGDSVGTFTYAVGDSGFKVIDHSDLNNLSIVRTVSIGASPQAMDIAGTYAYVATNGSLQSVDISVPSLSSLVGTLSNANLNNARDIKVVGSYAYVLTSVGLAVVNVATPSAPSYVTTLTHANFNGCTKMSVNAGYIFIGCTGSQLIFAVSISTPSSPSYVSASAPFAKLTTFKDILSKGSYVYATYDQGLATWNVSNPASIVFETALPTYNYYGRMVSKGNMIFGKSGSGYMQFSIATPNRPKELTLSFGSVLDSNSTVGVVINGSYLINFVPGSGVEYVNISDSIIPIETSKQYSVANIFAGASRVLLKGSVAYVLAPNSKRITTVDLTNVNSPVVLGDYYSDDLQLVADIAISGNYLFAAGSSNVYKGVVFDISNPAALVKVGEVSGYPNLSWVTRIMPLSSHFIFSSTNKLHSLSIADPTAPAIASSLAGTGLNYANALAVSGNYVYVCSSSSGYEINIVDASNPANLVLASVYTNASVAKCKSISVSGNYLYVASESPNSRLTVLDISSPAAPVVVGSVTNTGFNSLYDMAVNGNNVYVLNFSGIISVDVSNKAAPFINDTFSDANMSLPRSLVSSAPYVITANASSSLGVYELINSIVLGPCSSGGRFEYDNSQNAYGVCNGTQLKSMGPIPGTGGGACASPAGSKGTLLYFSSDNKFKYCDGASWVGAGS
ncbi:LVIVD repeat-containing protein [Bdellovibrio bacteriovorus]|uniref:LVIVD repeat-containing protein n=1 Tax=Bdellovibrio TaxID=958 RepID=UPI0035A9304A